MVGSLLYMYSGMLFDDNLENLLKTMNQGGKFEANLGQFGKALNKISKGKISKNLGIKHTFEEAQKTGVLDKAVGLGLGAVSKFLFNPYVIAGRIAVGSAMDYRKDYLENEMKEQILNVPDISDKYMINERYQAISNNSFANMDRVNMEINNLLNSGNLATNIMDRAFRNL